MKGLVYRGITFFLSKTKEVFFGLQGPITQNMFLRLKMWDAGQSFTLSASFLECCVVQDVKEKLQSMNATVKRVCPVHFYIKEQWKSCTVECKNECECEWPLTVQLLCSRAGLSKYKRHNA